MGCGGNDKLILKNKAGLGGRAKDNLLYLIIFLGISSALKINALLYSVVYSFFADNLQDVLNE